MKSLARRRRLASLFRYVCTLVTWAGVLLLGLLLYHVSRQGVEWLDLEFLQSFPSRFPERAGIKSALWGTCWVISFTALFAVPLGVASAIYLEEYARKGRLARWIEINLSNLSGVPSIVFGILGLVIFVRTMALERSVLAGSLTLALLILPVIVIAAREAIRAVPQSIRHASYALGATRWETVRHHVLPSAFPGILTGVILAVSRAIGETAPLIMIGALTYVAFVPENPFSPFTTLPIQIFNWSSRPQQEFHYVAAAGIIVLLVVLLLMNATAIYIRHRLGRKPGR